MELIFEIVSYHRLSPDQISKKSITDSITFGRSENNDWYLPDPEKVVSGVHGRIERKSDEFFIYDVSTNGLYINRSVEALGQDKAHKLAEGDLLTFGDYEVSVSIIQNEKPSLDVTSVEENQASPEVQGINSVRLAESVSSTTPNTKDFMPLINNDLNDHFDIPQAIPEEWDVDFLTANHAVDSFINDNQENIIPPKEIIPKNQSIPNTHEVQQTADVQVKTKSIGQYAFIEGLGISADILPESVSDQLMYEMGQCMQLMLSGLMESLRNRSNLKNEFRINQTTFQQQENNPLKFSATIDDAFQNLFIRKSSSFLPANKAIIEAFNDTKKHDIALTAGTLGAIEGILSQLEPTEIESRDFKESLLDQVLPGQKQLRYWKMYKSLHKDMSNEISNQGSSVLSDEFVRAYDKKIKSL